MEFSWAKSIFPIISAEFDKEGNLLNPVFKGTGFFTFIKGYPLIISAKHVLGGFQETTATPCIVTRYGSLPILALKGIITEHKRVDVTFMILEPNFFKKFKDEFHPIKIDSNPLSIGNDVSTFGYPNSQIILDDFSSNKIVEIDQYFFKGYITNIIDETSRGGTKKSYLVNFPSMMGASGSPLLTIRNKELVCVGFMFSGKSISEKVGEKEIELKGEKVTIPLYQTYNFGVACDADPLIAIGDLLESDEK